MRKVIRQLMFLGILLIGFVVLQGAVCGSFTGCGEQPEYPAGGMATIRMVNNSDDEVHMWATSSGRPGPPDNIAPDNKLMPGEERSVNLKCLWGDETSKNTITVYVGRNGAAFTSGVITFTKSEWDNICSTFLADYNISGTVQPRSNCP